MNKQIAEAKRKEWEFVLKKLEGIHDTDQILAGSIRKMAESKIRKLEDKK